MGVGFAVGTGRCGTKFLAEVFDQDGEIASHHERHPFNDTFHRYCVWYNIPVDQAGFIAVKRRGIDADLQAKRYSFEASAFLSLSIDVLHEAFGAKIVAMVRRPDRVVESYLRKGWYEATPALDDPDLPPTMQQVDMPHHFLGRTMPKGAEFERWCELTRVGKIAWYWNFLNSRLVKDCARLPQGAMRLQKLEDLDFRAFEQLRDFLGAPSNVTEEAFNATRRRRPNKATGMRTVHDWTERECEEFENEVRPAAEQLGYVWSTARLREQPRPQPPAPTLKQSVAALRRRLLHDADTRPSGA